RYRANHAAMLERLVGLLPNDPREVRPYVERWVDLMPFDARAQIQLLKVLLECGLPADAERHLAAIARLFEAEDLEFDPIRRAWQELRERKASPLPPDGPFARVAKSAEQSAAGATPVPARLHRASLAVMPFVETDRLNGEP